MKLNIFKPTRHAPPALSAGFTLIELLVVVLIIGILAAVALPQYRKSVVMAQSREMLLLVKSIANAQKAYFLENGVYSQDVEALHIALPSNFYLATVGAGSNAYRTTPEKYILTVWNVDEGKTILQNIPYNFYITFSGSSAQHMGKILCIGYTDETQNICKTLGGKPSPVNANSFFIE